MTIHFCEQFNRDPDTCMCIGFHGDGVPYTKFLKSDSVEVCNWNLVNEVDSEKMACVC